ncbi:MAG: hypothetical protein U5K75_01300 [Ahrensia sp.]|nr:hypothetical protein [Ahrensia sp.]
MNFNGAGVAAYDNQPAVKKRGQWVELQNSDLKNALDPITATFISAKQPARCLR